MTEQKLLPIDHCRHLAFAAIGGFFGGYALLCRGGDHSTLAGGAVCCCTCCVW